MVPLGCIVRGAILAAHGEPDRAELFLEARAYDAVPMLRMVVSLDTTLSESAIFVAGDASLPIAWACHDSRNLHRRCFTPRRS